MRSSRLIVRIALRGETVVDLSLPQGQPLQVGPEGDVVMPAPDAAPHLLEVAWTGPGEVRVVHGGGEALTLRAGERAELSAGHVVVSLHMVTELQLAEPSILLQTANLSLLMIVMAGLLSVSQAGLAWQLRCEAAGLVGAPEATLGRLGCLASKPPPAEIRADEFMVRLLDATVSDEASDAEQSDIGVDEPVAQPTVIAKEKQDVFLPAGEKTDEALTGGGGTKREKVRRKDPERRSDKEEAQPSEQPFVVEEAPASKPEPVPREIAKAAETSSKGDDPDDEDAPTEKQVGAGLQDWIDAGLEEDKDADLVRYMVERSKEELTVDPDDIRVLQMLAYYQYLERDYDGALKTYNKLIKLRPQVGNYYNNKALIFKRRASYAREEALYRLALALDPFSGTVIINLALNVAHQGRFDEAMQLMEPVLAAEPDEPYSNLHIAKIHAGQGNIDKALLHMERALKHYQWLDVFHQVEFRQDIRLDPFLSELRQDSRFHELLRRYYGEDSPLEE